MPDQEARVRVQDGADTNQGSIRMAAHRRSAGGGGGASPPPDQSDDRAKKSNLQLGQSGQAISGTQTFGCHAPLPPPPF